MADENNANNPVTDRDRNNPSTSRQNHNNDTLNDDISIPSSAGTLQMSMLENRLENEMTKMGKMMKDTVSGLTEHMNQRLNEVDRKFNTLLADLVPAVRNSNVNSSVTQPPVERTQNNQASGEPPIQCNSQPTLDRSQCKIKPQNYNGATDFDEFLAQFEVVSELNGWLYREKSLYLASCLTGDARSLFSELDYEGKRDYNTLVEKLAGRFGSENRSEIFRTQLKSRARNKGETIPELAQAIKKLVRQAYPGVGKDVIEILSIDHFIDALSDSDIRLRVREFCPKTLADAERTALRLESHKVADRQRSRLVGQIDSNPGQNKNETKWDSSPQFETLQNSIDSLTNHVKDLRNKPNSPNERSKVSFKAGKPQKNNFRHDKNGKPNRYHQSNPPPYGSQRQTNSHFRSGANSHLRSGASHHNAQQNQPARHFNGSLNNFGPRNRQNTDRNVAGYSQRNENAESVNNQENWNQSGWRATTRHY